MIHVIATVALSAIEARLPYQWIGHQRNPLRTVLRMSLLLPGSIVMSMTVGRFLVILFPLTSYCSDRVLVAPIILVVVAPIPLLITASLGLASTSIGAIHCQISACFKLSTALSALLDIGAFCHLGWKWRSATNLFILESD